MHLIIIFVLYNFLLYSDYCKLHSFEWMLDINCQTKERKKKRYNKWREWIQKKPHCTNAVERKTNYKTAKESLQKVTAVSNEGRS